MGYTDLIDRICEELGDFDRGSIFLMSSNSTEIVPRSKKYLFDFSANAEAL
jgi:hypothetical protein